MNGLVLYFTLGAMIMITHLYWVVKCVKLYMHTHTQKKSLFESRRTSSRQSPPPSPPQQQQQQQQQMKLLLWVHAFKGSEWYIRYLALMLCFFNLVAASDAFFVCVNFSIRYQKFSTFWCMRVKCFNIHFTKKNVIFSLWCVCVQLLSTLVHSFVCRQMENFVKENHRRIKTI